MNTHPSSPAAALEKAIADAQTALDRLGKRGINKAAYLDCEDALQELRDYFSNLREDIASHAHPLCADCEYSQPVHNVEPYGDRHVLREWNECTVTDSLKCTAVKAAGFLADDDLAGMIPPYLMRQAE